MSTFTPYNYNEINSYAGSYNPSPVKAFNNETFAFWQRSLWQRACSVLEWTCPEEWEGTSRNLFLWVLHRYGYMAIFYDPKYGYVHQPASLAGYNLYYQPTRALIANPALPGSLDLTIGKDCEILQLTPDWMGSWDIICYYAEKLSSLDNAINMSIINNKYAFIWGAKNKGAAAALKKIIDKVNKGEPAVIYDANLLLPNDPEAKDNPFTTLDRQALKQNYITTDQLMDFQTLLNNFDAEIGIPTIPYQKKERMVTSEADSRVVDSVARSTVWMESLQSSLKKIKALYPDIKLDVKLRFETVSEDEEGGEANEQNDNNRNL